MKRRAAGRSAAWAFFQVKLLQLLFAAAILAPEHAAALPSFSVQTNQPCTACHIDSYGPRLNRAGREFKLHGFTDSDGQSHPLPVSVFAQASFTHNATDNLRAEQRGFPGNDYPSLDELNGYLAGKMTDNFGVVASVSYQPDYNAVRWGDLDLRYARDLNVFGTPLVAGATINNSPLEADPWEADSLWTSPFVPSRLSKFAEGEPLIDMVGGYALGAGAYALWNDTLYVEMDEYSAMGRNALNIVGAGAQYNFGLDQLDHTAPYWRVALEHDFSGGEHHVEFGTYGFSADAYPYSLENAGWNHFEDRALDFTYQWTPQGPGSNPLDVQAIFLREDSSFKASPRIIGGPDSGRLSEFLVNATYTIHSQFTPGLEYFSTTGTSNPARWPGTTAGRPDSRGFIAELEFVPWGSKDSSSNWYNARAAVQYVDYVKYQGASAGATSNNAVMVTLSIAFSPGGLG